MDAKAEIAPRRSKAVNLRTIQQLVQHLKSNELRFVLKQFGINVFGVHTYLQKRVLNILSSSESLASKTFLLKIVLAVIDSKRIREDLNFENPINLEPPVEMQDTITPLHPSKYKPTPADVNYCSSNSGTIELPEIPFLKTISTVLEPIIVRGYSNKTVDFSGAFHIVDTTDAIFRSWNCQSGSTKLKIVLRLEQQSSNRCKRLPLNLKVSINGLPYRLPKLNNLVNKRATPCFANCPLELTPSVKLKNSAVNTLHIQWSDDPCAFAIGVYIVERLTLSELVVDLCRRPSHSENETKQFITELIDKGNEGVSHVSCSLRDPISNERMKLPVRSNDCNHIQCFDGVNYLRKRTYASWLCPICDRKFKSSDFKVDDFFLAILHDPTLDDESETIYLYRGGLWSPAKLDGPGGPTARKLKSLTSNVEDGSNKDCSVGYRRGFTTVGQIKSEPNSLIYYTD